MDWWGGKVSLGSLDLAGAVNKLQESVKNIEKNFDNALGFEDKSPPSTSEGSTSWSSSNRKALFNSSISFMGQKEKEDADESKDGHIPQDDAGSAVTKDESPEQSESTKDPSLSEGSKVDESDVATNTATDSTLPPEVGNTEVNEQKNNVDSTTVEEVSNVIEGSGEIRSDEPEPAALPESALQDAEIVESTAHFSEEEKSDVGSAEQSESGEGKVPVDGGDQDNNHTLISSVSSDVLEKESVEESTVDRPSSVQKEMESDSQDENQMQHHESSDATRPTSVIESSRISSATELPRDVVPDVASDQGAEGSNAEVGTGDIPKPSNVDDSDAQHYRRSSASNLSDCPDPAFELEKFKKEMKMMEDALQGAARQAQAKADEIAKLMTENEQLTSAVEDLRRKSSDAEIESLREEYHQRVSTLERKVYALTKERDTLRREQSKRTDAAALLKEKDEIINQVMAEGEELSKKQAAQEAQIRKLRAQIRELEEEKKSFITKLQLEENKVESIKRDKAATEKLLQETIEKHQAEMAVQKEYYTNALNAAKEAEALAEARANDEARSELEGSLREAEERETMLVQALEELRLALSRQEQQAIDKEDSLRRDIEDLKKRYQASERRCEELITQLPESTRPLLRQIEAMQEASSRKAEAWAAVERTLQSRLQESEAKAAAAEERERSINERLSQTLSRINVLEAQISCLRAEQTQLNRSLEKERQRAAENRQEYLAAKEVSDTHEGHVNQLEEEIRELKRKHKIELQESLAHWELLQQELEREKAAKLDLEKAALLQSTSGSDQSPTFKNKSVVENGKLMRKLSSASSVGNMEESFFLQASLQSSGNSLDRRNSGEITMSPYYLKSMTPNAFEAALRQKEGELASYVSRLTSMESIRDSLAEELVKMTEQCEKLRTEAAMLPGIRAEMDSLRRRHTAALELMGERDEELEELRADIVDLKEMYREQVNLLVNKIQVLSTQFGTA